MQKVFLPFWVLLGVEVVPMRKLLFSCLPCSRVCAGAAGKRLGFGLSEHWWLFLVGRLVQSSGMGMAACRARRELGGSEHRGAAHVAGIIR